MSRIATWWLVSMMGGCGANGLPEGLMQEMSAVSDDGTTRVEVATVRPSEAVLSLELPGEVKGSEDAVLAAAEGGIVERVLVKDGEEVRKGRPIVELDRAVLEAQLAQAVAQRDQAKAEVARLEQLGDLASGQQSLEVSTRLASAEANVKVWQVRVRRSTVRAPFTGVVGAMLVEEGEYAQPGAPVARLVSLDPVRVGLPVSDRDVVALKAGMEARVRTGAAPGIHRGTVAQIGPVADLSTRSFMVEIEVDNPERQLLPGMIARVVVDRNLGGDRLVIPQDWLVTRGDSYGVFLVQDGLARWRAVTIDQIVRDRVVLGEGLAAGDRVVYTGQHDLVDGDKLKIAREGVCCEKGRLVFGGATAANR